MHIDNGFVSGKIDPHVMRKWTDEITGHKKALRKRELAARMRFQSANAANRTHQPGYDGLLSSEEEPDQEPTDWIEKNINSA